MQRFVVSLILLQLVFAFFPGEGRSSLPFHWENLTHFPLSVSDKAENTWSRLGQRLLKTAETQASPLKFMAAAPNNVQPRQNTTPSSSSNNPMALGMEITLGIIFLILFLFIWNRIQGAQIRRQTQALKKSMEKYKTLSEKALVGIFQVDHQGRLIMANQRMAALFGFPHVSEFLGSRLTIREFFTRPAQFDDIQKQLSRTGTLEGWLVELTTAEKERLWGNLYIRQTRDDQGKILYEGFLEDMSQRHRHNQLLQARLRLSQMSGACATPELTQSVLESAEGLTASRISFFLVLNEDQNRIQSQTFSEKTLDKFCRSAPDQGHLPADQAGIWAQCIETMAPQICNAYPEPPENSPLLAGHPPLVRTLMIPVVRKKKVRAVLGLGNKSSPYTASDLDIANELADSAWEILLKNQAEIDLRASETRHRQFLETAAEGIWTLDNRFQTTFVNPTMAQKLGADTGALPGQPMDNFIFPEDMDNYTKWKEGRIKGIPLQQEARFKKTDGTEFWAIVSATPLKTPDEKFDGVFAMLTDIADRKKAELKVEQTRQRFLAILNGIESTIYVADMDTHEILFMNDYMKKLFGKDLTGGICWKALRNQDRPCPHCTNRFLTDDKGKATGIHLWEDQHPVTGRWNIYHDRAIQWMDGRPARLQVATDVTRLKTMESRQREYEEKIRQAQKMEALGALAGGIAHDFNNILFPILGYAELLKEEFTQDSRQRKGLEEILKGAGRARDLVEQILTFSRQAETRVVPLNPGIIIKEVIKLMRATLPATIRIDQSIARDVHKIMADPTQIHQVAMNLITNAFHAMESTGGVLTVRLENHPHPDAAKPGPFVRFCVSDTGPGMDPETLKKIFDPYFTTKPNGKGTGLGLSVVHGIVRKYKGDILVNSVPGEGCGFQVYLPAVFKDKPEAFHIESAEVIGGTERILLVDDEPQVLLLERELLQRLGYTVTTEKRSPKALDFIRENPEGVDLVITDMTMPEMSGDILTEEIRHIAPHLPVIICTGFSERLTPERIKQLDLKGLLLKPVSKADLAKQIRSALNGN